MFQGRKRCRRRSALFLLLATSGAAAEPPPVPRSPAPLAEALFRDGKVLMDAGQISQACAKLAESQRLEAALGTLLNLAVCQEREGKAASAWAAFSDAQAMAERAGDVERLQFARSEFERLRGVVPRLVIRVAEQTPEPEIRVDGDVLGQAAWGTAMPLDAGLHWVRAQVPGRPTWSGSVSLVDGAAPAVLQVPRLALDESSAVSSVQAPASAPEKNGSRPGAPTSHTRSARRTAGVIAGGVALAALASGSYWGLRVFSKQSTVESNCDQHECRNEAGLDADRAAHEAARWSDVSFGLGLVAATVSVYLLLTSRATPSHASAIFARPPTSSSPRPWLSLAGGPGDFGIGGRVGF